MRAPLFYHETLTKAKAEPLWALAFVATLLLPLMLIVARVGIEIGGGIIGLGFLWHSARTRDWQWLRTPFAITCIIAWCWLVLVVTPLAYTPKAGLTEALLWFRFPLMFAALRYWVLKSEAARTMLGAVLMVLVLAILVDTLWQYAHGVSLSGNPRLETGRLSGPFEHPKVGLYLGKLGFIAIALCLVGAWTRRSWRAAGPVLLILAATIVTILMTGERSALLITLIAAATTAGLLMLRERRLRLPCIAAAIIGVMVMVGLYQSNDWVRLRADQGFETMQHYSQSDYGLLARAGVDMGREHWLHGIGLRGFRDLCPDLPYNGITFRGMHPHNAFVEWFAETGAPGLAIFIVMIALLLREAVQHFRRARGLDSLAPAIAVGILVQHFFPLMGMQSFFTNWPAMTLWYPVAVAFAMLPGEKQA